ncbi:protein of unknown function DUF6 transmembrane [Methylorubrum populi BJ001]|uniref:EamA domain-containing protein n=1 Tax=Methylorubrum populi (strain ATCC BAA-705 / NCIMB 13946 / BJ001) TaxID=441620 RepID=B1Z7W9_METPB|nr:EamA family transporter [Methylorubrum populi]ACB78940.1 protein of unknown function DUF6 transmembrane [Methylorubrum populi BJ001]OAH32354.1 transporter [Methylorubrum populi]PZP71358.1 MAG: EamA family transporter [Methylorubrum populi]
MSELLLSWRFWALLSAGFAAATAILAKVGIDGVAPDVATFVRTLVVVAFAGAILMAAGQTRELGHLSGRNLVFLILSGLATGASWLCYFRALALGEAGRVAPLDKLSVVLVAVFGVLFLGERLASHHWLGVGLIAAGAGLLAWRA